MPSTANDHGARVSAGAMTKLSPEFRTERAREAGRASHTATAQITRFLNKLPELSDEQIETVRRALPPVDPEGGRAA